MRLINTSNGAFEEFIEQEKPEYSILSHTWGEEEVSYKDMIDSSCVNKKGYKKIEMTCKLAAEAGIQWAWVDTCCIDKLSSAELTEALNSMFQWYKRSKICYVILEDLPASEPIQSMKSCRWFTKGWTLQELIAPLNVSFFDEGWNYRGSKANLATQLSNITRISTEVLLHQRLLPTIPVAQRMSWAGLRETTRIEDMAYCLLGVFDVNMPLLYGEESKAFRRLQVEIIRTIPDLSIFGWSLLAASEVMSMTESRRVSGVLAQSPAAFLSCSSFRKDQNHMPAEFAVTNLGIKSRVQLITMNSMKGTESIQGYVLPLRCSSASKKSLGVRLRKCGYDQFVREDPWDLIECTEDSYTNAARERYFLTELPNTEMGFLPIMNMNQFITRMRSHVLQITCASRITIADAWNWGRFDDEDQLFFVSGDTSWDSAAIRLLVSFPGQRSSIHCSFYAVQWSSLEHKSFQYTLVEDEPITKSLDEIYPPLLTWNHVTSQVIGSLLEYDIPRTSSIAIKHLGMKKTAWISATATIEENTDLCSSRFWKVAFSVKLLKDENVPKINRLSWNHTETE